MAYQTLDLRRDGRILHVDIANPPLNLMTIQMVGELFDLAGTLAFDADTSVVVLGSANPDFFIAHFDLNDMFRSMSDPSVPQSKYDDINVLQALTTIWQTLPQVTIGAVDGICRGGGLELLLATDMRFATPESRLGFPEASGGFLPTGGGTTRLAMQVGPAPYFLELGTERQQQRWLPGIAAGELISAIAMTEPSGGSDLAALKTTAVRDGSEWVLTGAKTFITNGHQADLVIVAARTEPGAGARGITMFVVEEGMPGFTRGRKLDKVGQDEADTAELFFDGVRLPDSHRLGGEGQGFTAMMRLLPQERLATSATNVGQAAQILRETIDYVKERRAFGQAIGSFQYNKFLLAELVTKIDVTEAFLDRCVLAHIRGELSAADAAKLKWWSAEIQNRVLDSCVQLHGGYGFMNEYRVARAWRDARVTKIWAGTNEIMKEIIGRDLGL